MSGFEVLVKLVPISRAPKIAAVILSHLTYAPLFDLALANGAQAALRKTSTPGDLTRSSGEESDCDRYTVEEGGKAPGFNLWIDRRRPTFG
jgi:hypothetical protein